MDNQFIQDVQDLQEAFITYSLQDFKKYLVDRENLEYYELVYKTYLDAVDRKIAVWKVLFG